MAVLSIAWVYMFDACKTGRVASLCASFFFAALCVIYKAQFFVASALLIWVFPAMFFGTFSARRRAVWIAAAVLSYWLTLKFAEGIPSIPTIKLDGSGLVRNSEWIIENFDIARIREYLEGLVPRAGDSRLYTLLWASVMGGILFTITFGLFGPRYFALSWYVRSTASRMVLLFPLLVIITYLTMSVGLALNTSGTGLPDELAHRPFAWAYFVVCTWVGSAAWSAITKSSEPETRRRMSFGIVPLLLLVPWLFGKEIEVGPSRLWKGSEAGGRCQPASWSRRGSCATIAEPPTSCKTRGPMSGLCCRRSRSDNRTYFERSMQPGTGALRKSLPIAMPRSSSSRSSRRSPTSLSSLAEIESGGLWSIRRTLSHGQIPSSLRPHSSRGDTVSMNLDNEGCAVLS